MIRQEYLNQVGLLVKILPYIAKEECFALKGGTAINLFYSNLPRLSVDIDLTYINFDVRDDAYKNINDSLEKINKKLQTLGYKSFIRGDKEKKILCQDNNFTTIKIEPNYTLRGCIKKTSILPICQKAQEIFGYVEFPVLSKAETYGGKICAALDRQHPRDLFDIYQLIQNDGFDNEIIESFVVMLLSANRPLHEIIAPNILDRTAIYNSEFQGMTDENFTYNQHEETLRYLINLIQKKLKKYYKDFLLNFVALNLDFKKTNISNIEKLPAIKWKMQNLEKLKNANPKKFQQEYLNLKQIFQQN